MTRLKKVIIKRTAYRTSTILTCIQLDREVLDVGGGQPQRLDLAQLPVQRLGGDEVPETGEGGVDTLGPVSLPHVGDDSGFL